MKQSTSLFFATLLLASCNGNKLKHDAAGTFEATEVLISSEVAGVIKRFDIAEGQAIEAGTPVGLIDTTQIYLQKLQLLGSQRALRAGRPDVNKQITATREEIARIKSEKRRIENLLKGDAATRQQLDDIDAQLKVAEARMDAQLNSLQTNIESLDEQTATLDAQIAQIDDRLAKCKIINPLTGTVIGKYAEALELASPARPLYRIADLQTMFLRAYVTSEQLSKTALGQPAVVFTDYGEKERREYAGKIVWISDRAEFTPKIIQTKNERANLVYAVKIAVSNDGYLKIGMYGEVDFGN
ncbi:MAG: efflux RND transporter periplasmic adaptor subunit [Dysgonamonadaceae bacterium]|jgi:HlyD family secretion protein|nr:efflux RND transporter periplasmic adaptor subunit [Dysgonamonadaceae bacterium]